MTDDNLTVHGTGGGRGGATGAGAGGWTPDDWAPPERPASGGWGNRLTFCEQTPNALGVTATPRGRRRVWLIGPWLPTIDVDPIFLQRHDDAVWTDGQLLYLDVFNGRAVYRILPSPIPHPSFFRCELMTATLYDHVRMAADVPSWEDCSPPVPHLPTILTIAAASLFVGGMVFVTYRWPDVRAWAGEILRRLGW